ITGTSSTGVTLLDAVTGAAATTDDTWIVKINKYAPVSGTALDTAHTKITGPNNTQFSIGDLVEVYNSTTSVKTQVTVTATSASDITVSAAVGTGTGDQTKVAKLSTSSTPTEFL